MDGMEDPRRTAYWESFGCMYLIAATVFLAGWAAIILAVMFDLRGAIRRWRLR